MAISMQNAYAARLVEAARAMGAGTPAREIYERWRHQLDAYENYEDYPDHTLHEELAKRRSLVAEVARAAELQMPHNACSISVAVNLWVVQFGDGWVPQRNVAEVVDPGHMNWARLARRLCDVSRMEDQNDHWRVIT